MGLRTVLRRFAYECEGLYDDCYVEFKQACDTAITDILALLPTEAEWKQLVASCLAFDLGERYTGKSEYVEGITNERAMIFEDDMVEAILAEVRRKLDEPLQHP